MVRRHLVVVGADVKLIHKIALAFMEHVHVANAKELLKVARHEGILIGAWHREDERVVITRVQARIIAQFRQMLHHPMGKVG